MILSNSKLQSGKRNTIHYFSISPNKISFFHKHDSVRNSHKPICKRVNERSPYKFNRLSYRNKNASFKRKLLSKNITQSNKSEYCNNNDLDKPKFDIKINRKRNSEMTRNSLRSYCTTHLEIKVKKVENEPYNFVGKKINFIKRKELQNCLKVILNLPSIYTNS